MAAQTIAIEQNAFLASGAIPSGQLFIDTDDRRASASLFPFKAPQVADLAYAGVCVEAHGAGGDFYDFFDLGPNRVAFVIGDVAGKGFASALPRASIQATLRTLYAVGGFNLEQTLALLNTLLFESTSDAVYATLFFGIYDSTTGRLSYANCGHPGPLLRRRNSTEQLAGTSTVLGLFADWHATVAEAQLEPGDTLLLYTDGASEAGCHSGEEFGTDRLQQLLEENAGFPLSILLQSCLDEVRRFTKHEISDDLTLVALRCMD
jgi:sigma-B regulation protein RsbU (phosphoserine phosphatase)